MLGSAGPHTTAPPARTAPGPPAARHARDPAARPAPAGAWRQEPLQPADPAGRRLPAHDDDRGRNQAIHDFAKGLPPVDWQDPVQHGGTGCSLLPEWFVVAPCSGFV